MFFKKNVYICIRKRGISSVGRALGSQSRGQGFDPPILHKTAGFGLPFLRYTVGRFCKLHDQPLPKTGGDFQTGRSGRDVHPSLPDRDTRTIDLQAFILKRGIRNGAHWDNPVENILPKDNKEI